jgi:cytochrome c oxidase subunit 2
MKAKAPAHEIVPAQAPAPSAAGPQAAAAAAAEADKVWPAADLKTKGQQVYAATCAACHQPTGKGMPPAFPPLDGDKVTNGPKGAHIGVVLKGKPGTAMASFAHLSDVDIAAVITYERTSWSNKGDVVQPAEVRAARK